jgi:hypothetical protein
MASAPTPGGPGTSSNEEQIDAARAIMRLTVRGETRELAVGNVPIMEKILVREATGMPFERYIGDGKNIGEDSIVVLWWLAARAAGNKFLTFKEVAEGWQPLASADDLSVEMIDPDAPAVEGVEGDSPEG